MAIDTISESTDDLSLESLQHHPKVLAEIERELKDRSNIRSVRSDNLEKRQGNVEMLEWFLSLPKQIMERERQKRAGVGVYEVSER